MARNSYHSIVRVGNWFENKLAEEALQKEEARSRESKESFDKLTQELIAPAEVSVCPDGCVHYGDFILLHLPEVQLFKGSTKERCGSCTVCCSPSSQVIRGSSDYTGTNITASFQHHKPIIRNVFQICTQTGNDAPGDVLRFGSPFSLRHISHQKDILYLSSPSGSVLHSGRSSRRQEVLLEKKLSVHSSWSIQPRNKEERVLYHGYPVEVGARVNLIQVMTNQPLVVEEEFTSHTIFGAEPEVSVGVVNRATTRAASTIALLTWTQPRGLPQHHPEEDSTQEEKDNRLHEQKVEKLNSEQQAKEDREQHLKNVKEQEKLEMQKDSPPPEIELPKDGLVSLNEVEGKRDLDPEPKAVEDKLPEITLERMEEVQKEWKHVREQPDKKRRETYNRNIR